MTSRLDNRVRTFVIAALVGLVMFEGLARVAADRLPPPLEYHDQETGEKVAQLEEGPFETVLVGTSQVFFGMDPGVVAAALGEGSVYNAALSSGVPVLQSWWIPNHVVPDAQPDLVVWGVNPLLDFDAAYRYRVFDKFARARATKEGPFAVLDRWLSDVSYLARHRRELRSPAAVWGAMNGRFDETAVTTPAGGLAPHFRDTLEGFGPRGNFAAERDQWVDRLHNYRFGGHQAVAFVQQLEALHQRGIRVVVVEMPVAEATFDLLPGGTDRYEADLSEIEALSTAAGAGFLRAPARFRDDERFYDLSHQLPSRGDELAAWLGDQFRS